MGRGGPSIQPTFDYCRCGGRVLRHSWPGGKIGPAHIRQRWCPVCNLADGDLIAREFPGLGGAELNAALRRWQREEQLAGKFYRAMLAAQGDLAGERYAPPVAEQKLIDVMEALVEAQDHRAGLFEAGQSESRLLLIQEAATLADTMAPRASIAALARLAGRHWVVLVGTVETLPVERRLAVTRLGRAAVAANAGASERG